MISNPAENPNSPVAWIETPAVANLGPRYVFARPSAVWQAESLSDVKSAIERTQREQQNGRFVTGFIAYEAGPAFDSAIEVPPQGNLPLAWFAAFDSPAEPDTFPILAAQLLNAPKFLIGKTDYVAAVERILKHIRAGDIYQANYTIRTALDCADSPLAVFRSLLAAVPMPHAAYLDTGSAQIVSLSPELFLRKRGDWIEARPMKGTAPRKPSWEEDESVRLALAADEKNRAENVMIVDLMRNDLGRLCRAGTITVPELWKADRHPTVHQMTSIVRGQLRPDVSLFDIFAATFPPGSVTGAPKIRACQIIRDLEPEPRGIYCGTIGLFLPSGDFECNVAIRTLEFHLLPSEVHPSSFILHPSATLGLGSGIVADSNPAEEWKEVQLKGQFVSAYPLPDFSIYETIRYEPQAGLLDLPAHLHRLHHSCMYFLRPFPVKKILSALRELQPDLGDQPARIRVDVNGDTVTLRTEWINLSWPEGGLTVMLAETRLDPADFRLYHKTTLRPEKYETLHAARELGAHEVLFVNTRGEICEGALSNVLVKILGEWLTPVVSSGLLPGVWREKQLRSGRCRETVLPVDILREAEEIRMMNAVRGEGIVRRLITAKGETILTR